MRKPIIHVYSIMWNEEFLLPYFLRHYETFADKIFIIDDNSTDRTAEIAKAHPKVEVIKYWYTRGFNDEDHSSCFLEAYQKYSRGKADWVMCVDGDEFIYNKNMPKALSNAEAKGIFIIRTTGFAMVSQFLPEKQGQIYEECFNGIRSMNFDKPTVLKPELDVLFDPGRHQIRNADIKPQKAKLSLLHYRHISPDYLLSRSSKSFANMGMPDAKKKYLIERGLAYFDKVKDKLKKVV